MAKEGAGAGVSTRLKLQKFDHSGPVKKLVEEIEIAPGQGKKVTVMKEAEKEQ
jgi:hypothetical protein